MKITSWWLNQPIWKLCSSNWIMKAHSNKHWNHTNTQIQTSSPGLPYWGKKDTSSKKGHESSKKIPKTRGISRQPCNWWVRNPMFFEVPGGHKISISSFPRLPAFDLVMSESCLSINSDLSNLWMGSVQAATREWYFTNLLEKKHLIRFGTYYTNHASPKKYLSINCTRWQSYWKFNSKTPCDIQEPSNTHVVQNSCIHDCQDTSLPDTFLWLPLLVPTTSNSQHFLHENNSKFAPENGWLEDYCSSSSFLFGVILAYFQGRHHSFRECSCCLSLKWGEPFCFEMYWPFWLVWVFLPTKNRTHFIEGCGLFLHLVWPHFCSSVTF